MREASSACVKSLQRLCSGEDGDVLKRVQIEEVEIAGDDAVDAGGEFWRQDLIVIRIATHEFRERRRRDDLGEGVDLGKRFWRFWCRAVRSYVWLSHRYLCGAGL